MKHPKKTINLALQGGGALGSFTWGVLDQILLDERVHIESISGTSAGAVNGVVMAYGLSQGGRDAARSLLHDFWHQVSAVAGMSPLQPSVFDKFLRRYDLAYSPSFMAMEYMTRMFSPYQLNLLDYNPLRDILEKMVDFEQLQRCNKIKLFINATHVKTGKKRIFPKEEITLEAVMASACLPHIYKTVYVDGEPYWDGGYSGNPSIYPFIYECGSQDVVLVQINPLYVDEVPTGASEILDRLNEINFNAALMQEMRAIAFVSKLKKQGTLGPDYKDMRIHMISANEIIGELGRMSKMNADWEFLKYLYETGQQSASDWLDEHYEAIGVRSSVDIAETFL
jgi:NTE family protein